jgi:hypothetical protein
MTKRIENKLKKLGLSHTVENEVRVKRPQLCFKADYGKSRSAAIQMFCIICMGDNRTDAAHCKSYDCPLWSLEFKKTRGLRPKGYVPTEEQYQDMTNASVSDKQREAGKRLAKERKNNE